LAGAWWASVGGRRDLALPAHVRAAEAARLSEAAWSTSTEFAASLPRAAIGKIVLEFTITYNAWPFGGRTEVAPAPHCCSKSWSACRADAGRQTRKTTLILKFNQG